MWQETIFEFPVVALEAPATSSTVAFDLNFIFFKSSVPARKICIRKALTDQETFERETASFEVEISHTGVEGIWQKNGIRVKPNNQWRVSTNGLVHSLTLSNLTLEDTGTIAFSAEGVRTSARLTVKGKSCSLEKGGDGAYTQIWTHVEVFGFLNSSRDSSVYPENVV